jgi:hypothetical protein
MDKLTTAEARDFKRHIKTLKNFTGALKAGEKALIDIIDRKLFRHKYDTIEECCEHELGWSRRRYYQLRDFQKIKESLPEECEPLVHKERQTRALKSIPEEHRAEVLEEAAKSGKVTAKSIAQAAKVIQIDVIEVDKEGHAIPTPCKETWRRRDEVDEYLVWLSRIKSWAEKLQKSSDKFYAVKEFSAQEVYTDCGNLRRMISTLVPYSICATCQGQAPNTCASCHGKGMISKHAWDHGVSAEVKKMMKQKASDDAPQRLSATGG